jgi:hypothetical protein
MWLYRKAASAIFLDNYYGTFNVGTIAEFIQVCNIPRILKKKFREVALDL